MKHNRFHILLFSLVCTLSASGAYSRPQVAGDADIVSVDDLAMITRNTIGSEKQLSVDQLILLQQGFLYWENQASRRKVTLTTEAKNLIHKYLQEINTHLLALGYTPSTLPAQDPEKDDESSSNKQNKKQESKRESKQKAESDPVTGSSPVDKNPETPISAASDKENPAPNNPDLKISEPKNPDQNNEPEVGQTPEQSSDSSGKTVIKRRMPDGQIKEFVVDIDPDQEKQTEDPTTEVNLKKTSGNQQKSKLIKGGRN